MICNFPLIDGSLVASLPRKSYLISGPIMTTLERRQEMIEAMAQDIIANEAHGSERDALRLLYHKGWGNLNVPLLAGEALDMARRYLATQGMVAREIAQP